MLRNVEVGMVESLELSKDLTHVVVHARIRRNLRPYLTTGTRFWVVRPRLGAGGVSGLNTLFSGVYLEMEPGKGRPTETFEGLDEPPVQAPSGEGKTFLLRARELGGLSRGSPVYYRGLQVGEVLGSALAQDAQSVADQHLRPRAPRRAGASGDAVLERLGLRAAHRRGRVPGEDGIAAGGPARGGRLRDAGGAPRSGHESARHRVPALPGQGRGAGPRPTGLQVSYLLRVGASVRGLEVDSPVELLGIRVGKVTDVHLEGEGGRVHAVVTVSLEPERACSTRELPAEEQELRPRVDARAGVLIDHGLRAELKSVSLLTGARVVALGFRPGRPEGAASSAGPARRSPAPGTGLRRAHRVGDAAADRRAEAGEQRQQVIASPELAYTLKNLDEITQQASKNIGPTMQSLQKASAQLEKTLSSASGLLGNSNTGAASLPRALRDLREASRSVRLLTDYLERHPEALVQGKRT